MCLAWKGSRFSHNVCFAIIFHFESVKYTHLLKQALSFQNKQIMRHLNHLGLGQLYYFVLPSVGVLSLLKWELQRAGYNTAGYSTRWILCMNRG